jgi:hypothetical protein
VNEGGEKPHKGTAFSRERSHYLGRAKLCSAFGEATQGNLGGSVRQAHERRLGEGRAIAEAEKTLERTKLRRASSDHYLLRKG